MPSHTHNCEAELCQPLWEAEKQVSMGADSRWGSSPSLPCQTCICTPVDHIIRSRDIVKGYPVLPFSTNIKENRWKTAQRVARCLVVSMLDQRPQGRGFESTGCGLSCSNRGPVALCTLGLGLLNPPSFRGR